MNRCRKWSEQWAKSMPDEAVARQIEAEGGLVTPGCIPEDRLQSMVEQDLLPSDILTPAE